MNDDGEIQTDAVTLEPIRREYPQRPIPSSHAITFRAGKALLIKRAHPPSKGRWSVPGGMIEPGETIHGAARREICEECGIQVKIDRIVDVADNIVLDKSGDIRFHYVVIYLLARYVSGTTCPHADALETRWVMQDELGTLVLHPLARQAVQKAFKMI